MLSLRAVLDDVLARGLADDPIEHARQVAALAGALYRAFAAEGLRCTLVGGSAIEVHAPGVLKTGDIDLVIEAAHLEDARERIGAVFDSLGFERAGRHWKRRDLFVEVPGLTLDDPAELVRVGHHVFRVIAKEVVLADRIVGFKHWRYTGYGEQAIEMLAAFGGELRPDWLMDKLRREDAVDAFEALSAIAKSAQAVSDESLRELIEQLHRRPPGDGP